MLGAGTAPGGGGTVLSESLRRRRGPGRSRGDDGFRRRRRRMMYDFWFRLGDRDVGELRLRPSAARKAGQAQRQQRSLGNLRAAAHLGLPSCMTNFLSCHTCGYFPAEASPSTNQKALLHDL